jgi:hypothetical protein
VANNPLRRATALPLKRNWRCNFFKNNISSSIDIWGLQLIRSTQLPVPITETKLNIELSTKAEIWFRNSLDILDPEANITNPLLLKQKFQRQEHITSLPTKEREAIMKLRIATLFPLNHIHENQRKCNLCNLDEVMTVPHLLHSCKFPNLKNIRLELQILMNNEFISHKSWWDKFPLHHRTCIIVGADWSALLELKTSILNLGSRYALTILSYSPWLMD